MEVQFVSANIDEASGSREALSVALESDCLEKHSYGNQKSNCDGGNGQVEQNLDLVRDGKLARKNWTRTWQMSSYGECAHERQHHDESGQAQNLENTASWNPPPQHS